MYVELDMESSAVKNPEAVFKILEDILRQTYGERDMLLIYKYLEEQYGLPRSEFANNIDLFAKGLESILSKFAPHSKQG